MESEGKSILPSLVERRNLEEAMHLYGPETSCKIDVLGKLIVSGNVSNAPQIADWAGDAYCTWDGIFDSWEAMDFVAHDPTIEVWTDQRIYCER